jgi:sigma-B regulation protein RsbU (phosphoserine phosphatase)
MDGSSHLEAKLLYRRLDSVLGALDVSRPGKKVVVSFLEEAFRTLREDLRLRAAVLYAEGREGFAFVKAVGDLRNPARDSLDPGAPPVSLVLQHGVYIFADPGAEGTPARAGILPRGPAAALAVGSRGDRHLIFLLVGEGWVREELDFALNTVRAALGSRLMEERVRGSFREAAEIQQSLLLDELPEFPGYELAARSVPTEEVGGDFFDFIPFDGEMLGMAIGDASGHGLPAALLVRDLVTGLRMGIERELKVAPVLTKLNRVIHRSRLSSRFVSVFYGELEAAGNLIYVNAGHQPPLLFSRGRVWELSIGGTVIGPLPEVKFNRGVVRMDPGDVLVAMTDGIFDRRSKGGEFFGEAHLHRVVEESNGRPAADLLDRIFTAAFAFGDGGPWEDDATAVVIRRLQTATPAG